MTTRPLAELIAEALDRPKEERAELAEVLWDSFEPADAGLDPTYAADLQRRADEARAGTSGAIPWADLRKRVEAGGTVDAPG